MNRGGVVAVFRESDASRRLWEGNCLEADSWSARGSGDTADALREGGGLMGEEEKGGGSEMVDDLAAQWSSFAGNREAAN